jgi:hypothetical protein
MLKWFLNNVRIRFTWLRKKSREFLAHMTDKQLLKDSAA